MKNIFIVFMSIILSTSVINAQPVEQLEIELQNDSIISHEVREDEIEENLEKVSEEIIEINEVVENDVKMLENTSQHTLEVTTEEHEVGEEAVEELLLFEADDNTAHVRSNVFDENEWEYTIDNDKIVVKKYIGSDVDVILPAEVEINDVLYNVEFNSQFRIRENVGLKSFTVQEVNGKKVTIAPQSILRYTISQTFSNNSTVEKLDLRGFDVSQVTDMSRAFSGNQALSEVDMTGWNTSQVLSTESMFSENTSLRSVDVTHFDMSRVNSASSMFNKSAIEELDLSSWNTEKFWRVSSMFYEMPNLRSLDVTGWKMNNAESFTFMFKGLESLESVDLSSWDISGVTALSYMFYDAKSLKDIDLSGWDTSAATILQSMFSDTPNLETLNVNGWDTSNITNMQSLFYGSGIEHVDLSSWNTENLMYAAYIFRDTPNLKTTGIENWNVQNLKDLVRGFENAQSIETLDLSNWKTDNLGGNAGAFSEMDSLRDSNIDGFKFQPDATIQKAFSNSDNLRYIDLSHVDLSNVTNFIDVFQTDETDIPLTVISNDANIIDYDFESSNRISVENGITIDAGIGLFSDGEKLKQSLINIMILY